jgi:hypothetical protein
MVTNILVRQGYDRNQIGPKYWDVVCCRREGDGSGELSVGLWEGIVVCSSHPINVDIRRRAIMGQELVMMLDSL